MDWETGDEEIVIDEAVIEEDNNDQGKSEIAQQLVKQQ